MMGYDDLRNDFHCFLLDLVCQGARTLNHTVMGRAIISDYSLPGVDGEYVNDVRPCGNIVECMSSILQPCVLRRMTT